MLTRFSAPHAGIPKFFEMIRSHQRRCELIRVGSPRDGGYLVPNDFEGINYCFSPGVANCSDFEEQLSETHGIYCYLADASVETPPDSHVDFDFEKKFLGKETHNDFVTLDDWVHSKLGANPSGDGILQMDIEGAEFEVIAAANRDTLRLFRTIVLEVHAMDRLFDPASFPEIEAFFAKLLTDHVLVHLHPNNYEDTVFRRGFGVPKVFEMTLLRRDRAGQLGLPTGFRLPHPLDASNHPRRWHRTMPRAWWKQR